MEKYLSLIDLTASPYVTALLLGLLINVSPCPLCTNITAIGFLSKDLGDRKKMMLNSLLYMLGKTLAYVSLGVVLYFTMNSSSAIQEFLEHYGEKILGPILVVTGVLLLDVIKFHKHDEHCNHKHFSPMRTFSSLGALGLGVAFALAFCPYSGVLYFGVLIPLSIKAQSILLLFIFSIATVIPVFLVSWTLAYGISSIANMQNKLNVVDKYVRLISAVLFIAIGLWVCYEAFICVGHHHHG